MKVPEKILSPGDFFYSGKKCFFQLNKEIIKYENVATKKGHQIIRTKCKYTLLPHINKRNLSASSLNDDSAFKATFVLL